MLKLYYGIGQEIEIGEYHALYDEFIQLIHDNPRDTSEYPTIEIDNSKLIGTGGSGFKAMADAIGTEKRILYTDAALTKPTHFVVQFPYWSSFTKQFKLFYRDTKGDDFLIDSFLIPSGDMAKYELRSWYCTDGNDTILSYVSNILTFERSRITAESLTDVVNAAYSPLSSFFIPCMDESGLTTKFTTRPLNGYEPTPASCYINSASAYYMLTGNRVVEADNFVNANVNFTPGFSYDPRAVDYSKSVKYNYSKGKILTRYNATDNYTTSKIPGVNKRSLLTLPFVQVPENIYKYTYRNFNNGTYQNLFRIALDHGYYDSEAMFSGTSSDIGVNGVFDNNADGDSHTINIIQLRQLGNLSRYVSEDPDNTDLSDVSDFSTYKIPGFAIACTNRKGDDPTQTTNSSFAITIIYLYGTNVGDFTHSELFDWAYNNVVQESKDPEQYPEHKDQEDPDGQPTGGFTDNNSDGGDGTWSDEQDDTAIDPDGNPETDPVAPMPKDLNLSGNVHMYRIDGVALESLANQAWQDEGFLKHISSIMGRSRIGDGVQEVKTFMLPLPVKEATTIDNVAGYTLQTAITAHNIDRYHQFNFGTISIPKYFDNFLDFSATQFMMQLPFGGSVKLNPEDLIGKDITVVLRVDAFDGTGLYFIQNNTKLITTVPAQLTVSVPFSTSEYTMSGRQFMLDSAKTIIDAAGAPGLAKVAGASSQAAAESAAGSWMNGAIGSSLNAAHKIAGTVFNQEDNRPIQSNPGGAPGDIGVMGTKNIILYTTRPYVTIPNGFYDALGCTSNYIVNVADCKGYFEIEKFMGQLSCTDSETAEIISLLKAGVLP